MDDLTQIHSRSYAEEWLEELQCMERCIWCGEDEKPLNQEKLCDACLRTRRRAAKVRQEAEAISPTATDHERWKRTHELRIAEKMVEICQLDGKQMQNILNSDVFDAVSLEKSLCDIARYVCHQRNFFHGKASRLALLLTPKQRRILAYMLWKPRLVDRKRRRTRLACRLVHMEDLRLAERQFGLDANL